MNTRHAREAIVQKINVQLKYYTTIARNNSVILTLLKETAQECEEQEMSKDVFGKLAETAVDSISIMYKLQIEQKILEQLLVKVHETEDLSSFSVLDWVRDLVDKEVGHFESHQADLVKNKIWKDEEFIDFLKHAWDGNHPDEQFNAQRSLTVLAGLDDEEEAEGQSASQKRLAQLLFADDENDDVELEIVGEQFSFKCPITQRIMDEVLTSKVCKHSFSTAILSLCNSSGGRVECPVAGCRYMVNVSSLFKNKALNRKLQRLLVKMREQSMQGDEEFVRV